MNKMAFGIDEIEMGNRYIDQFLREWDEDMEGNDTFDLLDMFCFQSEEPFDIDVRMKNADIKGLDTIHRPGDCALIEQNGRMSILADLGTGYVCLNFDVMVRLAFFTYSISFNIYIDYIQILMKFSADSETGKDGILHDLKIMDMRGMDVKVRNGWIINWVIGLLYKSMTFTKWTMKLLEYQIGQYLNDRIQYFRFRSKRSASDCLCNEDKERKTMERGNLFMDKVIEIIVDYEFCNDGYLLDNIEFNFERNTPYGNICFDTILSEGHLKGLKTLDRLGSCSFYETDGRMHINAALTTGLLNVKYQGCFRFLSILRPHFSLDINIANVTVCLYISVNSSTGQNGILHKFFVENIEDISVNFTGLRPFNKPINFLNRGLIKVFRNYIDRKLEKLFKDHIKSKIAKFTFPNKKVVYYKYKLKIPPHSQSPYKFSPLETIEEFE